MLIYKKVASDKLPISNCLLITGCAGFVGSNFVHHCRNTYPDDQVIVLDALTYGGNRHNLASLEGKENFRFVEGNICDRYQAISKKLIGNTKIE